MNVLHCIRSIFIAVRAREVEHLALWDDQLVDLISEVWRKTHQPRNAVTDKIGIGSHC